MRVRSSLLSSFSSFSSFSSLTVGVGLGLALVGCANDPVYIPAPEAMEAGVMDEMGMRSEAKASLLLPIKTETAADAAKRAALAAQLMVDVPYVRIGDLEIEIEWTIENLDQEKVGLAQIELDGANELFSYDPTLIILNPDDDEAPPTPGLDGNVPIEVAPGAKLTGLFTEDQVREASIDLDQITRGNVNPFRASLTISKNAKTFQPLTPPMPGDEDYVQEPIGAPIPREAFAALTRIDLVFKATTFMKLEYNVRVRDIRGILHDLLLTAVTDKPGELAVFEPMVYAPAPAAPAPAAR
ncbi:MAG: hypothetical protein H7138_23265 [Myxococcales bacterium]|nr:hypothetical protein [Myxococcales bacterium]